MLDHIRGTEDLDTEKEVLEICSEAKASDLGSPIQFAKILAE